MCAERLWSKNTRPNIEHRSIQAAVEILSLRCDVLSWKNVRDKRTQNHLKRRKEKMRYLLCIAWTPWMRSNARRLSAADREFPHKIWYKLRSCTAMLVPRTHARPRRICLLHSFRATIIACEYLCCRSMHILLCTNEYELSVVVFSIIASLAEILVLDESKSKCRNMMSATDAQRVGVFVQRCVSYITQRSISKSRR